MSLLHDLSKPAIRGSVDLFSVPATDTTTDYSVYGDYQPTVNIQDCNTQIDFVIPGNSMHYLDLSDSFLYLVVKVMNEDGTNLDDNENVSTANLFMHSLFSQVDVYFNSQLVSSTQNYAYKAYLQTLLTYGYDYQRSQGNCSLYFPDSNNGTAEDANTGYATRKLFITKSNALELIDKLRLDLSTQHKYILNDINIRLSLTRSSDAFSLMTGEADDNKFKIKILNAVFYIRKHVLYPSIILAHQKLLDKGEVARYPYKKTEIKYFTVSQGSSCAVEENLFSSSIPSRIVLGFVNSASFIGDVMQNPFKFENCNISSVSLTVNNISVPVRPYNLNFEDKNYLLPYYMLFTSTGIAGQDTGLWFDRCSYKEFCTLFSFDIVQGSNPNGLLNLDKTGNVKIEVMFKTPLTRAYHCVVMSEHQSVLEINKFRQITHA